MISRINTEDLKNINHQKKSKESINGFHNHNHQNMILNIFDIETLIFLDFFRKKKRDYDDFLSFRKSN